MQFTRGLAIAQAPNLGSGRSGAGPIDYRQSPAFGWVQSLARCDIVASMKIEEEHGASASARALSPAGRRVERSVERVLTAAAARPRRALGALLVVTALLATGLPRLRFETGILDWLPEHHPNVRAFGRVLTKLDGLTNQELLWVELDEAKAERAGVATIHDPDAVRAQQELVDYVRARVPDIRHAFGLPHWFSLMHRVQSGDPEALRLPSSDLEFRLYWTILSSTLGEMIDPTLSEDERGTCVGLVLEGNPLGRLARDVGHAVAEAVESYKRDPDRRFDLFRDDLLLPVGLASGTAFIDRSLREDVFRILPLAIAFLIAALVVAFRRPFVAGAGIATVLLGVVWTYGLMGHLGVPLNIVNVALVPLVFGCGVDYAIHILNEYSHVRSRGLRREEVLRVTARTSGVGILLTTLTTVVGLLAITLADAPGMVQLGLFASFAMIVLTFLAVTFLPAVLSLRPPRDIPARFRESRLLGSLMIFFGRHRRVAFALFLGVTALFAALYGKPVYLMDVIEGNYRPDEPLYRVVERMKEEASGAFPEFVIVEGDLADPEVLAEVDALENRLLESEAFAGRVVGASYAAALGAHEILKLGAAAAIPAYLEAGGDLAKAVPSTRDAIRAALDAMTGDPAWRPVSDLFIDPSADIGLVILLVGEGWEGLDGARRLWKELEAAVAGIDRSDLRVSFLGYRTMSYLFVTHSLFWLRVLFFVSLVVALGLVGYLLRDRRAVVAVGALMLATGVWWLALLHLRGIYISVFLLFPLIFIVCIGSDYGLHLCWRLSRREPPERVYRTTGKAILFSAATDGGVFALFVLIRLVSASQVMEAVALAVLAVFVATTILVPAAYGAPPRGRG
jgi:predicted RND superfamily exporter protein